MGENSSEFREQNKTDLIQSEALNYILEQVKNQIDELVKNNLALRLLLMKQAGLSKAIEYIPEIIVMLYSTERGRFILHETHIDEIVKIDK